jgi:hypothetical protein
MKVRNTSVSAFEFIKQNGVLGERQAHAYEVLYFCGPLTGQELSVKMGMPGQWKRCSELKKRGLAIEVGEAKCSVTGQLAILWDVTENMPSEAPKYQSRVQRLQEEINDLKRENEFLRQCLGEPKAS